MNAAEVSDAIAALEKASRALRSGALSIAEQIALASECHSAAWHLRRELETLNVEVTA